MGILRGIGRFLWDWGGLLSGALSVPIAVASFYLAAENQRALWYGFAVATFVLMFIILYAKEHQRAEQLAAQLSAATLPPDRQPLNEFAHEVIEKSPVTFTNDLNEVFWRDVRQAAVDGELSLWGRSLGDFLSRGVRIRDESKGEPLVPITPEYWRHHRIEHLSLFTFGGEHGEKLAVVKTNDRVRSSSGLGGTYSDLHLHKGHAAKWAARWIAAHKRD